MTNITQEFHTALNTFVANCQAKIDSYFQTTYKNLVPPTLVTMPGKKYVRIVQQEPVGGGR